MKWLFIFAAAMRLCFSLRDRKRNAAPPGEHGGAPHGKSRARREMICAFYNSSRSPCSLSVHVRRIVVFSNCQRNLRAKIRNEASLR